jgi:hypothetical protein
MLKERDFIYRPRVCTLINEDALDASIMCCLHLYDINHPTSHPDNHEDKTQQEGEG